MGNEDTEPQKFQEQAKGASRAESADSLQSRHARYEPKFVCLWVGLRARGIHLAARRPGTPRLFLSLEDSWLFLGPK